MAIIGGTTPTYQSFTDEMQDAAFNLGVGLFGIPMGTTFLSEISNYMTQTQGATIDSLYEVVLNSSVGQMASFYPTYLTDAQFAERLANNLIGTSGTLVTADAWTAGKDWVVSALQGGMSRAAAAKMAVDAVAGLDTADATYGAAAAAFANKVTVANYYTFDKAGASSDITTLQNVISGVTNDAATVTTAQTSIDNDAVASSAKTVTLTTNADIVGTAASVASALQTTNFDDIIVAYAATTTASTLGNADSLNGGGGTDTLRITAENTARISPIGSSIEVVELFAVSNETASIGLANLAGVTALTIKGTSDADVNGLANGINVTLNDGYTKTAVLSMKTDSTADSITLNVGGGYSAGIKDGAGTTAGAGIETVNLVATANFRNDEVFSFANASAMNISGTGNVVLNLQAGSGNFGITGTGIQSGDMLGRLGKFNASALEGTLTMYLSTAGIDQSITGGAGADTFYASGGFNQSDVLDGGAGNDSLTMAIGNTGTLRPVITSVENLTIDFNADAVIDMRNSTAAGIQNLNVLGLATASTFSALASSLQTINVMSGASAGGLTFNYVSGAASDVVINLTNQTSSTSTAAYDMGDLTVANNSGALTLNVVGSATGQAVDAFAANNASTLTVNVTSGQFGVSAMNANAAKSVTLNVTGGHTATVGGAASFSSVTALTVNVDGGGSARADFSAINLGANGNVVINMGSAATSMIFSADSLNWGNTASTAAMGMSLTVNNKGDGDVLISGVEPLTAAATARTASQVAFDVTVTQSGAGAVFGMSGIDLGSIDTAALNFTFAGQGSFTLNANATLSAVTGQVVINATALNTAATLTANFTAFADTNVTFDVRLGENSAVIALGAGGDQVQFGNGAGQYVRGGAGNDQITMSTTAASIAQYNNTAASGPDNGNDTIFGASTGDVILFADLNSAGRTAGGAFIASGATAAINSGAAMSTATLIGSTASGLFFAMYTAAGDMILEMLITTASLTASAAATADITHITLNGKGDIAKSALLRVDASGSGLAFTLL